jgi:hypothetical protein
MWNCESLYGSEAIARSRQGIHVDSQWQQATKDRRGSIQAGVVFGLQTRLNDIKKSRGEACPLTQRG